MSNIAETKQDKVTDKVTKEFEDLLKKSFEENQINEGKVIKGTIVSI